MKAIRVSGRVVMVDCIEQILMPDAESAAVWLIGRAEPLHARTEELAAIHEYVREVMA